MATSMRGAGVVGYNVQAAVDTEHHLIVAHDVTNIVTDRTLLSPMARMAKEAMAVEKIDVLADRGYFSGDEVLACEAIGATPHVPKPLTSNARAAGRFGKDDFVYLADQTRIAVQQERRSPIGTHASRKEKRYIASGPTNAAPAHRRPNARRARSAA